jgi:hypothetical protein
MKPVGRISFVGCVERPSRLHLRLRLNVHVQAGRLLHNFLSGWIR